MARKTKKKTKKKAAKKTAKKTTRTASGRGGSLGSMSTEALQAELRRRNSGVRRLERKREKLLEQLGFIEKELATMGAPITAAGGTRKRPKNDQNLEEALVSTLKGKTMGVTEAAEAVQRNGYLTSSANFRTIVNQTLIRSKGIKKIARGQYTAK